MEIINIKTTIYCTFNGDPNGIRTHDTTVKGWCLNRLTMGPKAAFWWLRTDSNHRPVGYEPNALAS